MLFTPAYAQSAGSAAGSAAAGGGFASLVQFAPLVLIAIVFYFLLIRPQQTQAKTLKATLSAIKRGDKVVTAGGIVGTVKKAPDNATEIDVEIAPSVIVSIVRGTITKVLTPQAANDPA